MLRNLIAFSSSIRTQSSSSWTTTSVAASIVNTSRSSWIFPVFMPTTSATMNNTNTSPLHQSTSIRLRSTRSTRGLYDGKDVRFGNNVPFSQKKTRRRWNPNMQYKAVYSEVLDEMVKFHLTTSALRTIDKYGGLDEYLLRSKHVSTKGEGEGQRVRNRIIQKMKHRELLKQQAIERGESVEDWDRIVLVGKKIRQQQQLQQEDLASSSASLVIEEEK
ncbi:hypothetical protein ACHAWU_010065 [Discostella pseudostelligera]|uniref:Large ribosomal subunit protein bL28m n=1 Tax=Discostella pseudostelligera TaxID=259834 RepID=A0ABD3N6M3_9STRA